VKKKDTTTQTPKEVKKKDTATQTPTRAVYGSWSRWGELAEQGEAGSGLGRRALPCQRRPGAPAWPLRG
jgi:hypothetical protein